MDYFDKYLLNEEQKKIKKKKRLQFLWVMMIFLLFIILAFNGCLNDKNKKTSNNTRNEETPLKTPENTEKESDYDYEETKKRLCTLESIVCEFEK